MKKIIKKTTTTMEKNFYAASERKLYMYDNEIQALAEVTLLRQRFYLNTGKSEQDWKIANTDKTVTTHYKPATETEPAEFDGKIYLCETDFKQGTVAPLEKLFYSNSEGYICDRLVRSNVRTDDKGAYFWACIKGEAVRWYFCDHIDVVTWEYDGACHLTTTSDCEGELPEAYDSSEEVYKYNDYRYVDSEGNEQVREALLNRLRLEPDQQQMVEKLHAMLKECKKAGIKVYFNTTYYEMKAVNVRNIDRIEYDPCVDEDERAIDFADRRVAYSFGGDIESHNCDDYDMVVVKTQTNGQ